MCSVMGHSMKRLT
uniref:Uncharacterized protein n=1 Tax=Arundo donax TaxID=35708 RepID=A0A0A8ZSZ8_ARUDO